MKLTMRIFNLVFCVLFISSAALQYNDPDPYIWIPIYGYAAILCWLAFREKYFPFAYLIGIIFYAPFAAYKFFKTDGVEEWIQLHNTESIAATMQAAKPWIEETREFFALLILIIVMLIDYFYSRRQFLRIRT